MFEIGVRGNGTDQEQIGPGENALLVRTIGTAHFIEYRQPHQGRQRLPITLEVAIHRSKPEQAKRELAKLRRSDQPVRDRLCIGRRIREMRGDITQAEFAERIGISQNYLSTMERGKVEIGAEILVWISREFVKSVEWLLTGEGTPAMAIQLNLK